MIVSYKPPYSINTKILRLVASISEKLGVAKAQYILKPTPQLRKQNRIKTIHASLQIEGNRLTREQITAIIENKKVIGPEKDMLEVLNAVKVYDAADSFSPFDEQSFLEAHRLLMTGLVENPGQYRTQQVGVFEGSKISHLAPPPQNVPSQMNQLFHYLDKQDELLLIKSCVFHYELEFIHPFLDGNGRLGRFWQTVILMKEHTIFEFLPFETLIRQNQDQYYATLAECDASGESSRFIEFMLEILNQSLEELLVFKQPTMTDIQRLDYFLSLGKREFTRKDYMSVFKNISSATASRDLKKAVEMHLVMVIGTKNQAIYKPVPIKSDSEDDFFEKE
jgi:Fic family protein